MTKEQRAEQLMAKGPVWLVRRVMELERLRSGDRPGRARPDVQDAT